MWFIVLDGGKFDYVEKLIMFIFIKKFVDNLIKDREKKIIIYVDLIKYKLPDPGRNRTGNTL